MLDTLLTLSLLIMVVVALVVILKAVLSTVSQSRVLLFSVVFLGLVLVFWR